MILSVKERSARCRLVAGDRVLTLRARIVWQAVRGEIVTVKPSKQWSYGGHPYLSDDIESTRLDMSALGLARLRLEDQGIWDPDAQYWGEVRPRSPVREPKIGRNDPCPCGSGKTYKKCCGKT